MGRLEILTGHERRRVWSDAQKLEILSDVATSGQSIVAVARRHDIVPQQIYSWRKQFDARRVSAETGPATTFLPVRLVSMETSESSDAPSEEPAQAAAYRRLSKSSRIEIGCKGGRILKVDSGIAPDVLKSLIRSVEEA